jgi:SAM-dependent methyltransferase
MGNINDLYFDGEYKNLWKSFIPDELTAKEVEFLKSYFQLHPGQSVLDLMCGYGRHSIALAKLGLAVTSVDNLEDYIAEIDQISKSERLGITAMQLDAKKFIGDKVFDLILCMGNSFNFFDPKEAQQVLLNVSAQLKEGGSFLLNSWSIAEITNKHFQERAWNKVGEKIYLIENEYLFHPTRIEFKHLIISPNGDKEAKEGIDYIYSISETEAMFNNAGLALKEVFSIPGKKIFKLGDPRAYFVAFKQ